jgi:cytochrome c1
MGVLGRVVVRGAWPYGVLGLLLAAAGWVLFGGAAPGSGAGPGDGHTVAAVGTPRAAGPDAPPARLTPAPGIVGDPDRGRRLFTTAGCAGCHTIAGVPGATGVAGPNLTNVVLRPTLAGETIPFTPENLRTWLLDPPALKPGTTMPGVGLRAEEAADLAAFLYSQPNNVLR